MVIIEEDIANSIEAFVKTQLHLLKPVGESWQPQDLLPDMASASWQDDLSALRKRAEALSDEALVVLVGNLITEEALPSYQTWLNRIDEIKDVSGVSDSPWALWSRGWTAEENRHGDVLNKYLYLSGRVNMRSVEITIQHLIRNGFDLKSGNDPYKSLVYASFQERATRISHANTGKLAEKSGDAVLSKICGHIAADEARHEEAYKRFYGKILEVDPSQALIAFAEMLKQNIAMPARLMSDGTDRDLFSQFAIVAQKSNVYTTRDYADIIGHLVGFWRIASMQRLSSLAQEAQEYVCGLSERYLAKAERIEEVIARAPKEPFTWIFDRAV